MSDPNTGGGLAQSGQSKGGHATAGMSPQSPDQMLGMWTPGWSSYPPRPRPQQTSAGRNGRSPGTL